jgi:hypothetical protein
MYKLLKSLPHIPQQLHDLHDNSNNSNNNNNPINNNNDNINLGSDPFESGTLSSSHFPPDRRNCFPKNVLSYILYKTLLPNKW